MWQGTDFSEWVPAALQHPHSCSLICLCPWQQLLVRLCVRVCVCVCVRLCVCVCVCVCSEKRARMGGVQFQPSRKDSSSIGPGARRFASASTTTTHARRHAHQRTHARQRTACRRSHISTRVDACTWPRGRVCACVPVRTLCMRPHIHEHKSHETLDIARGVGITSDARRP